MAVNNIERGDVKRVVLLAREGKARDKLKQTLGEIGAELVLESDPSTVDAAALQAVRPQALLVALEPAVEDALDRLDAAINDAGYAVIFDDADVAAKRDGWDAQRWARHLSAKLHGHGDVLPPGREEDEPGFAVAPRAPTPAARKNEAEILDFGGFALDLDDAAAAGIGSQPAAVGSVEAPAHFDFGEIDLVVPEAGALAPHAESAGLDFSSLDFKVEDVSLPEVAEAASAADDFAGLGGQALAGTSPSAPAGSSKPVASFDNPFANLSLVDMEPVEEEKRPESRLLFGDEPSVEAPAQPARFEPAASEPPPAPEHAGRASFSIVEDEPVAAAAEEGPGAPGAVLLFAGMGGPDAVRKVLAELPKNFAKPVLVNQRLDGGSYANLVRQLERIATMPVKLAEAGHAPAAGTVYVVPTDVAIELQSGSLGFGSGESDFARLLPGLPPADSAVLLLSGADQSLVEAAHALSLNGGFVAGQSAQNCYDPAAARALAAKGCEAATPNELAAQLAALW